MDNGLGRFLEAQENDYAIALEEIREGKKRSHWMWYIFPQMHGLGHSSMAQYYGIRDIDEAKDYLRHPVLGARLKEISGELLKHDEHDPKRIFGQIDAMKLRSCMTLFVIVEEENNQHSSVFRQVLQQYYDNIPDEATLERIHGS